MTRSSRPFRFLSGVLVIAAGFGLTSCGDDSLAARNTAPAVVATVNGKNITGAEFVRVLNQYSRNRVYVNAESVKDGKVLSGGRAAILSSMIQQKVFDAAFTKRKLTISKKNRTAGKAALISVLVSEDVYKGFSSTYRAELLEDYARRQAVFEAVGRGTKEPTDAQLKEYFLKNTAEFPAATPTVTVQQVQARLAAGEDFGAVATEVSTDTGSASQGGDLGCAEASKYVKEFAAAVEAQPIGEVSQPVKTDFGYHLVLVYDKKDPGNGGVVQYCVKHILLPAAAMEGADPFEAVKAQVREAYFLAPYKELFKDVKVTISSKEGYVNSSEGYPIVAPPTTTTTTTTTTTSAAGGSTTTTTSAVAESTTTTSSSTSAANG